MNRILNEIKQIIEKNIKEYLPEVKLSDLEENGAIYYMNAKNGTEFDWYVNNHLPFFMVFYNDEKNLGAVKLSIYDDGKVELYIYGDRGNTVVKEIKTSIKVEEDEMLQLAVILKNEAEDNRIWDANIDNINTDINITDEQIKRFKEAERYMEPMKKRMNLLNKMACVSNKILDEDWKVGYMDREQPVDENDSGWMFTVGDEEEEYLSNYENITLLRIYELYQLDPDIWKYIDNPVGTKLIRISSNEFEIDKNDKEIYMEKRKV